MGHSAGCKTEARSLIGNFAELLTTRGPVGLAGKAFRLWRREGYRVFRRVLSEELFGGISYAKWVKSYDALSDDDRRLIALHIDQLSEGPRISIVMPVYNTPAKWLRAAITSVRTQLYPNWELCIADDASSEPHVREILESATRGDSRIKVVYRTVNGHISAASNSALELATGQFVALLDHDDELAEHALYLVAAALEDSPDLDLIYSDEDKVDQRGRRYAPYFKPDWNPELFMGQNMISHLGVYRTSLVRAVGGFREGFEGAQDWDLAMRVVDATDSKRIHHIPHLLYHWRAISGSTAKGTKEKEYAVPAVRKMLNDHLRRKKIRADIQSVIGGHFRVQYALPDPLPLVSIIVPTRNGLDLLRRCIAGLFHNTAYSAIEIIVVDNRSDDPATMAYLGELKSSGRVRILRYDAPFNFSAINNMAVKQAKGELVCLLNNDVEPINADWLREMVSHAWRSGVGAVGAMLYYPDDTIQHAGVYLDGYVADHFYVGQLRGIGGDMNRARLVQELSAVTAACLVVRKSVWDEVGGLDEDRLAVAFNDIDFCLKVKERGYRNVWTPFAELYHHESATRGSDETRDKRGRFQREIDWMRERWGHRLQCDRAVNPNRAFSDPTRRLADPPRSVKPWRALIVGVEGERG
jgi:GT2 family glycosyltransferase